MKVKVIAEKYHISKDLFDLFLEGNSGIQYTGVLEKNVKDCDVPRAVALFKEEMRRREIALKKKEEEEALIAGRIQHEKELRMLEEKATAEKISKVIVTTGDLPDDYETIGPVYFQISNKGVLGGSLSTLKAKYTAEILRMREEGTMSKERSDWGFLYGEWSVGQNDFEVAFYIATQELKKRAYLFGGDAVICMRQDIDIDTNGFAYFYLQMYGTAVKVKKE